MNKDAALRFEMLKAENYRVELLGQGREEGRKEGLKEGQIKGEKEKLDSIIKTMSKNGFSKEDIAKAIDVELSYINEVLKQK